MGNFKFSLLTHMGIEVRITDLYSEHLGIRTCKALQNDSSCSIWWNSALFFFFLSSYVLLRHSLYTKLGKC